MTEALNFLQELHQAKIRLFIILGNHDIFNKNSSLINSIDPILKDFPNITIIRESDWFDFDGLPVAFTGWITPENREAILGFINDVDAHILCGHFEINNFEISEGTVCYSGLSPDTFDRFDKVFSGHFHVRATNGKITYLGNPYQTNWGEFRGKKGFHIFDTKTQELSFIENQDANYHAETYDPKAKFQEELYQDRIVRIYLNGGDYNKNKFNLFLERVGTLAHNVEVIESKEILTSEGTEDISTSADVLTIINHYIDLQDTQLDRNRIKGYVYEIYRAAIEQARSVAI